MRNLLLLLLVWSSLYATSVRIKPENITVSTQDEFNIDVVVEDVANLVVAEVTILFNKDFLKVETVTSGVLNDFFFSEIKEGSIKITGGKLQGEENGTCSIASIQFLVLKEGEGSIAVSSVVLMDLQGAITVDKIEGANVYSFPSVKSLDGIYVYPNPWRIDRDRHIPYIEFILPKYSDLSIYTISGRLIREFKNTKEPVKWMLNSSDGNMISSGMYIYLVKNKDKRKMGKVGVIR